MVDRFRENRWVVWALQFEGRGYPAALAERFSANCRTHIAPQPVRKLLPHEGRVPSGRRLRRIELRGSGAPHHRRRYRALFVMTHNFGKLRNILQTHDHRLPPAAAALPRYFGVSASELGG